MATISELATLLESLRIGAQGSPKAQDGQTKILRKETTMEERDCNHPLWEFSSEVVTNAKGELQPRIKAKYSGTDPDPLIVVQKSQAMLDEQNRYIANLREF